jgi:hypothetical protein
METSNHNPQILQLLKNTEIYDRLVNRLKIGYDRYGQGVDIYQEGIDWKEMALEEIEDCIIYLCAIDLLKNSDFMNPNIQKLLEIHKNINL